MNSSLHSLSRTALAAFSCLALLTGCGGGEEGDGHGHGDGHHHVQVFSIWPEDGATVYQTTPMAIGSSTEAGHVHGTVTIQVGGEAPKQGQDMPEGVLKMKPGLDADMVTLPAPGKHTLHVCLYDEQGKATEHMGTVTWTVEESPADMGVTFVGLKDGAKVSSPLKVTFGVSGAEISASGPQNNLDKTMGHHHVIIDGEATPIGMTVPADDTHLHYGGGQTEAEIELEPGSHTLTMQLADGNHRSYGKLFSTKVRVIVE